MVELNDLLLKEGVDPREVIVLRHKPTSLQLSRLLPWFAEEQPGLFNAYQQTQVPAVEKVMLKLAGSGHVASFIGQSPGKATFAGLYQIASSRPLLREEFWNFPEHEQLKALGSYGFGEDDPRETIEFFDLRETDFLSRWKGKLIIDWNAERSWWRRAHQNSLTVSAILEDSAFVREMPDWESVNLSWAELLKLPRRWKEALSHWRGIYFIHDVSDGRGYVGSAYGKDNLHGRWMNYAATGHGGNVLLRGRDPTNFCFAILQRVSPDMPADEVSRIEATWKERLHTRGPHGLNEN